MRIVCWNCNGGFSRKTEPVLALRPDLLVIQEISEKDTLALGAASAFWTGRKHRGLAVISLNPILTLTLDPSFDPGLPWFLPVHIGDLRMLAVWASVLTHKLRYVRLIHHALDHYASFLPSRHGILLGDLNSNTVFDGKHEELSHSALVRRLHDLGYASLWHTHTGEPHGGESRPTFYMYRRPERTWHLDYAFTSHDLMPHSFLDLASPNPWLTMSDHLPLVLDLNLPPHPETAGRAP